MDHYILVSSDEEPTCDDAVLPERESDINFIDSVMHDNCPFSKNATRSASNLLHKNNVHDFSDSDDSDCSSSIPVSGSQLDINSHPLKKKRPNKKVSNEEKQRKKEAAAKEKAEKKKTIERLKKIKPGECMKYVTVLIDSSILTCSFGGALLTAVQSSEAKNKICSQLIQYSITWEQEDVDGVVKEQNQLVVFWTWELFVQSVSDGSLNSDVKQIKDLQPCKNLTLVIFGLEGYFKSQKLQQNKKLRKQLTGTKDLKSKSKSSTNDSTPVVSRDQVEKSLTEIQLMSDCCHRLLETGEDVGLLVMQFTKAIAETPYKKMMHERTQEKLNWFAAGDSKDCVRVDKNGNGLLRLWQQQICQFNLVGLDMAEAIVSRYKTPQALIEAYSECTSINEAELLLKDLQVRRGTGPLATSRRIGPELSKKVYLFFNSDDEQVTFSQDG